VIKTEQATARQHDSTDEDPQAASELACSAKENTPMRTIFVRQNSAFRILIVATLITLVSASSASARVAARYGGRGQFVSMSGSDASGCVWLYVNVSKGGPNGTEETFLNYYAFDGCTNTEIASGYGRIANAAFVVTGKSATLNTTPGSNSSLPFTMQGATGSISLTFKRTGLFTYAFAGHTIWESGTVVVRTHGAYTYADASVAGSVVGLQLGNASSQFGSSRERTIEIEQK
jgi:hypothetical protein